MKREEGRGINESIHPPTPLPQLIAREAAAAAEQEEEGRGGGGGTKPSPPPSSSSTHTQACLASLRDAVANPYVWVLALHYAVSFGVELVVYNVIATYFHEEVRDHPPTHPLSPSTHAFLNARKRADPLTLLPFYLVRHRPGGCGPGGRLRGSHQPLRQGLWWVGERSSHAEVEDERYVHSPTHPPTYPNHSPTPLPIHRNYSPNHLSNKGRLWVHFVLLVSEAVLLLCFSAATTYRVSVALLLSFSIFTQACSGSCFALVPYLSNQSSGSVSGVVGSGG